MNCTVTLEHTARGRAEVPVRSVVSALPAKGEIGRAEIVIPASSTLKNSTYLAPLQGRTWARIEHAGLGIDWEGIVETYAEDLSSGSITLQCREAISALQGPLVSPAAFVGMSGGAIARNAFYRAFNGQSVMPIYEGTFLEAPPALVSYAFPGTTDLLSTLKDLSDQTGQEFSVRSRRLSWTPPTGNAYAARLTDDGDLVLTSGISLDATGLLKAVTAKSANGEATVVATENANKPGAKHITIQVDEVGTGPLEAAALAALDLGRFPAVTLQVELRTTRRGSSTSHAAIREGDVLRLTLPGAALAGLTVRCRVLARSWQEGSDRIGLTLQYLPDPEAVTLGLFARRPLPPVSMPLERDVVRSLGGGSASTTAVSIGSVANFGSTYVQLVTRGDTGYYVDEEGADSSGATDSYAAIARTRDKCLANRIPMLFGNGTYVWNTMLEISADLLIRGNRRGTTVGTNAALEAMFKFISTGSRIVGGGIEDLNAIATTAQASGTAFAKVDSAHAMTFRDLTVNGFNLAVLFTSNEFGNSEGHTVENVENFAYDPGSGVLRPYGVVKFIAGSAGTVSDSKVISPRCEGGTGWNVELCDVHRIRVLDPYMSSLTNNFLGNVWIHNNSGAAGAYANTGGHTIHSPHLEDDWSNMSHVNALNVLIDADTNTASRLLRGCRVFDPQTSNTSRILVKIANSGTQPFTNRYNKAEMLDISTSYIGWVTIGANVYKAIIETPHDDDTVFSTVSNAGTATRINGTMLDYPGAGADPAAANLEIGNLTTNGSDNRIFTKDRLGVTRQFLTADRPLSTKTGAYTLTNGDSTVIGDTTGGTFTLTLPTAVGRTGRIFTIKKKVAANTLNIGTTSSQTIDGAAAPLALTAASDVRRLQSDGANWITV